MVMLIGLCFLVSLLVFTEIKISSSFLDAAWFPLLAE